MHPQLNAVHSRKLVLPRSRFSTHYGRLCWLGVGLILGGCASSNSYDAVKVESRPIQGEAHHEPPEEQDSATPYQDRQFEIEQAEYYQNLARRDSSETDNPNQVWNASLSSAEYFIQANDFARAEGAVRLLQPTQLDAVQRDRFDVVMAYIDYARHRYQAALQRLDSVVFRHQQRAQQADPEAIDAVPLIGSMQLIDALLLSSFCQQRLGQNAQAVEALILRESFLDGPARAETSRYIWQVIDTFSVFEKEQIISSTLSAAVRTRVEQSSQGQIGARIALPTQFDQWRDSQPGAPSPSVDAIWDDRSPRNIAVIVPLSSKYKKAAQAVVDGITFQHSQNLSPYTPNVSIYDIGEDAYEVTQHYDAAISNGADFVIGPLGRDYANHLSAYARQNRRGATLLLGGDNPLGPRLSRLTMSPEWEGIVVADRATEAGYINAALLVPEGKNGKRTAAAFQRRWLALGGRISNVINYSTLQFDHTTELKQLFNIGQSEYRHTKLSNTLESKPKFSAYRRADIDFVFMIADNAAGRLLRPQIDFFGGSAVPVLAGSSVFNGIQDHTNNVDLDQTHFPVMPWILRSSETAPYAGQLNMLFAMGADAYQVASSWHRLSRDSTYKIKGNMGQLGVDSRGEVRNQPLWASFNNGVAETTAPLEQLDDNALDLLNPQRRIDRDSTENRENSYDESNWNPRTTRRKTGS